MNSFGRMVCTAGALLRLLAPTTQAGDIAILAEELLSVMKQPECHAYGLSNFVAGICQDLNLSKPKGWQSTVTTQDVSRAASAMGWSGVKANYVTLYANTFTAVELQTAIEFYKTPSGQLCLVIPFRSGGESSSQLDKAVVKGFRTSQSGQSFIKKHDALRRQEMAIDQVAIDKVNLRLKALFGENSK